MELLINIDEDVRIAITRVGLLRISDEMQKKVDKAIQRGTPLPKGHGRLIDSDELKRIIQENDVLNMTGFNVRLCDINNTPTIIEADKETTDETDN